MDDDERENLPLDQLDIEWVQPRVCAETFDNRRQLRENGHRWRTVPPDPDTGMPSGLIEVPDPMADMRTMHERHKDVLADPRDPWSDYVDVREIPMDATGVPFWIHRRVEQWEEWDKKARLPGSKKSREPYLPVRCSSLKKDGTRCWSWAADEANEGRCRAHAPGAALAANMGHNIALAKVKVMQAMPAMVDELEAMVYDGTAPHNVRLKAITEMMDRGGVNAQTDVNVTGGIQVERNPADEIRERLSGLAERLTAAAALEAGHAATPAGDDGVVDAELVGEGEAS